MPLEGHQLSIGNALALMYARGFRRKNRLIIGAAVMTAESDRYTRAYHVNDDGSIDRGLWQLNNVSHPNVDDETAYHAQTATDYAFQLSRRGTDWSPWAAFNSGLYEQYLAVVSHIYSLQAWRLHVPRWEE